MISRTELHKLCKKHSDPSVGKILKCSARTVCIFNVTPTNIVKIGKRKVWYWLREN